MSRESDAIEAEERARYRAALQPKMPTAHVGPIRPYRWSTWIFLVAAGIGIGAIAAISVLKIDEPAVAPPALALRVLAPDVRRASLDEPIPIQQASLDAEAERRKVQDADSIIATARSQLAPIQERIAALDHRLTVTIPREIYALQSEMDRTLPPSRFRDRYDQEESARIIQRQQQRMGSLRWQAERARRDLEKERQVERPLLARMAAAESDKRLAVTSLGQARP